MLRDQLSLGLRSPLTFGEVEVLIATIGACQEDLAALAEVLSAHERDRAGRFKCDRDRERYVWRQAVLRFTLAERLGCRAQALDYEVSDKGKPQLGAGHGGAALRFNMSHSDGLIAIAFTQGLEVGVDVERIRSLPDLPALVERCMSRDERQRFRSVDVELSADTFMCYWTRKEAVLKAMGTGLSVEPDQVCVEETADGRVRDPFGVAWRVWSFRPQAGWWGAVACEAGTKVERIGGV